MSKELNDIPVRQFKLSNSEDLLGLVTGTNEHYIFVERPAVVYITQDGRFRLEPWFQLSSQNNYKININQVISSIEVDDSVKAIYLQYATHLEDMEYSTDDDSDYEYDLESIDMSNQVKH